MRSTRPIFNAAMSLAASRPVFYSTFAIVCAVAFLGACYMELPVEYFRYVYDHTGGYMTSVYFGAIILLMLLIPLSIALYMEYPLWESKIPLARELSNMVCNARNGWGSLAALCLFGAGFLTCFVTGVYVIVA